MLKAEFRTLIATPLIFASIAWLTGCSVVATPHGSTSPTREAVYHAATNRVSSVVLHKPASTPDGLAGQAAPLFMIETHATNEIPLTVEWTLSSVTIRGEPRPAVDFIWRVSACTDAARGLRVILGADGLPVLWEVLDANAHLRVFYVSRRIEALAAQEHGGPLKNRTYASEPEDPRVVVARVLDDAPVLMGPIIYLNKTAEVVSVICRCMPAQADALGGTQSYSLQPATQTSAPANIPLRLPKAL
jgi:hypothetical protein